MTRSISGSSAPGRMTTIMRHRPSPPGHPRPRLRPRSFALAADALQPPRLVDDALEQTLHRRLPERPAVGCLHARQHRLLAVGLIDRQVGALLHLADLERPLRALVEQLDQHRVDLVDVLAQALHRALDRARVGRPLVGGRPAPSPGPFFTMPPSPRARRAGSRTRARAPALRAGPADRASAPCSSISRTRCEPTITPSATPGDRRRLLRRRDAEADRDRQLDAAPQLAAGRRGARPGGASARRSPRCATRSRRSRATRAPRSWCARRSRSAPAGRWGRCPWRTKIGAVSSSASSGGRSTQSTPSTPDADACSAKRSTPRRWMRLK